MFISLKTGLGTDTEINSPRTRKPSPKTTRNQQKLLTMTPTINCPTVSSRQQKFDIQQQTTITNRYTRQTEQTTDNKRYKTKCENLPFLTDIRKNRLAFTALAKNLRKSPYSFAKLTTDYRQCLSINSLSNLSNCHRL
jgi:hypothetical protein